MYKNQLQELAQRSCFNLPSYTCIREGPDHAPRFRASVNFNGEIFHCPGYCTTLRQAEHAAAEVALNTLSTRGPSRFLAAKVLDEIGVYKNLLQESVHRAGLTLPVYTTERSGPAHLPVFISIVELAGMNFTGESAQTKKQAEKNAAMAAWSALKQCEFCFFILFLYKNNLLTMVDIPVSNLGSTCQTNKETECSDEQQHVVVARMLANLKPKDENRSFKQRDHNQVRKKMESSYMDKNSGSSSKLLSHLQQWKPTGSLSDSTPIYPSAPQQKGSSSSCFVTLLNRTTTCSSRLLPPTLSTDKSNNFLLCPSTGMKEVPPPLEEHQKDDDEWLNGKQDIRANAADSNSVFMQKTGYHHKSFTMPSPRMLNSSRNRSGIAQAVHIRSVIPVCATPPRRPQSSISPIEAPAQKNQDVSSSVSKSSVLKQTEQEAPVAEASSKLDNLHL